jgi:hypothetical protein
VTLTLPSLPAGHVPTASELKQVLDAITQSYGQFTAKTSTTTVSNTITETVLHTLTIPAGFAQVGMAFNLIVWGTADITGTPTLTTRVRLGGLGGTSYAAIGVGGVVNTQRPFRIESELICVTTGASATWLGTLQQADRVDGSAGSTKLDVSTGTFIKDSTVSQDLVITAQWSVASVSNTLRADAGFIYYRIAP